MGTSFLDAIRSASRDRCIGRDELKSTLLARHHQPEHRLTFLIGPGGIGKTTLLNWLADEVRREGGRVAWVSGEQVAPNPGSFLNGLRCTDRKGPINIEGTVDLIGRSETRDLVVIDSFEKLRSLQRWIITEFFGLIGPAVTIVLASRERMPLRERTDLAIADLVDEIDIGPLGDAFAASLLHDGGVAPAAIPQLVAFARGYPLALRLMNRCSKVPTTPSGVPVSRDVLDVLVDSFVSNAPSPVHMNALYCAAIAHNLNEAQLAAMLDQPDVDDIYRWLCQTTIVERTDLGVSPHALVRDVLFSHLQTRNPEMLERLQARLIDALVRRIINTDVTEGHELILQALYARRNAANMKQYLDVEPARRWEVVALSPPILARIRELVRKFEGDEGLASYDKWQHRPSITHAIVDENGDVKSFQAIIRVPRNATAEDFTDPLIEGAWRAWRATNPPRDEGDLHLFRWFMEAETYQEFTPAMTHLMTLGPIIAAPIHEIVHIGFATTPAERWAPLAPSFQLHWARGAEATHNGRPYGFFFGSQARMRAFFQNNNAPILNTTRLIVFGLTGLPTPTTPLAPNTTPAKLSREVFARTLRQALNHLHEPQQLRDPQITLLLADPGKGPPEALIAQLVAAGIRRLAQAAGTSRYATILEATYLRPVAKQHAAAMDLGLPYGTYRYQLRKAVTLLEEELWHLRLDESN